VLAETIHRLSGRQGPLLRVNCAALSETLLESELFGHEKGAFTGAVAAKAGLFESAAGGTVLLDEIGETSPGMQAKLLRVLETREAMRVGGLKPVKLDVRFISATHRDLPAEVAVGTFRRDLYYRLNGITLKLPPLRERRPMIPLLAARFAEETAQRQGRKTPVRFAPDSLLRLQQHDWPGNVRELKTVIERAVLLAMDGDIRPEHLLLEAAAEPRPAPITIPPPQTSSASGNVPAIAAPGPVVGDEPNLSPKEQEERQKILAALDACGGNQTRAAKMLGISRATLVHKLDVYRLPRPRK
jgi:DNA-binding NtrC family response regulator